MQSIALCVSKFQRPREFASDERSVAAAWRPPARERLAYRMHTHRRPAPSRIEFCRFHLTAPPSLVGRQCPSEPDRRVPFPSSRAFANDIFDV